MADYIRRLVSGGKARFRDEHLDVELDLVYLTDHVIIMGYPANGIEGLYRNRREDAKKFLEHRHGKNYWIFNFCPIRENSYDPSFFDGRVSRYPFPDHHASPLAIMPLVAREMRAWLKGSPDRVAVLHCKAGKGRSGTMACSYLLSLDDTPSAPKLERSYSAKQWAQLRADDAMAVVPPDDDVNQSASSSRPDTPDLSYTTSPATSSTPSQPLPETLKSVLDLHSSRRMKPPSSPSKKPKQGVSIPSQRRWLYYWALLLAHAAPSHIWTIPPVPRAERLKVRLTQLVLRIKASSSATTGLVRVASKVLERTKLGKNTTGHGGTHVWVSLARYDDDFVEELEEWERRTRDESGRMGMRKPGSEHFETEELGQFFDEGRWDREKMVRSFARLGAVGEGAVVREQGESKDEKIDIYTLHPLTSQNWDNFREELQHETGDKPDLRGANVPDSEANSMYEVTQSAKERGVVLDAGREVRVKLYMGQVFMGWLWFIPTFHMSPTSEGPTKLLLTRKELDFPLGIGSAILDLEIQLEWLAPADAEAVQPPVPVPIEGTHPEDETVNAAAALSISGVGMREGIEAMQASKN